MTSVKDSSVAMAGLNQGKSWHQVTKLEDRQQQGGTFRGLGCGELSRKLA